MLDLMLALGLSVADPKLAEACAPFRAGLAADLSGARYVREQARDPDQPLAVIDDRESMLLMPDGRFLLRTSTLYPGRIEFRFRTVGDAHGEDTIDELRWRDGDVMTHDDAATAIKDAADLRARWPGLMACEALDRGAERVGDQWRFTDTAGLAITLVAGPDGALAEARVSGGAFIRYEPLNEGGVRVTQTTDGRVTARWTVRARPARPADAARLTLPPGYRPTDPAGPLRATALGEGVYRVDGTPSRYHTAFVAGERAVVLFDAPVGPEEAASVRALVESTAPGVPIRYVVISHVHRDHAAGLPAYADAEVLVGAGGAAALRRQLAEATPRRMTEVSAARMLDLGGRAIRILPLAGSQHASTMLVGYDETSNALFQGDLFYLPERGPTPPAFDTGRELRALIQAERLKVGLIVGVHGRTGDLADLRRAIALRDARVDDQRGCVGRWLTEPRACQTGR